MPAVSVNSNAKWPPSGSFISRRGTSEKFVDGDHSVAAILCCEVECVAACEVVFESLGGPDAELGAALGFHAVADGYDHVEVVVLRSIGFPSGAVVKESLTTEPGSNSPSLNTLRMCRLTFCLVV